MDGRCATCTWWSHPDPDDGMGCCVLTVWEYGNEALAAKPRRAYALPNGTGAILVTAPDFGCTEWKAKP